MNKNLLSQPKIWMIGIFCWNLSLPLATADQCSLQSSNGPLKNEAYRLQVYYSRVNKHWFCLLKNLQTNQSQKIILNKLSRHAHLELFLSPQGHFAILDTRAGHRLKDRLLIYHPEGKLITSWGITDLLTKPEQEQISYSKTHVFWLQSTRLPTGSVWGTYLKKENVLKLTSKSGREILVSLTNGQILAPKNNLKKRIK